MSEQKKFTHGVEFQRAVLKRMLTEDLFCSKCSEFLKEEYFLGELRWFFRKISGWYKEYSKQPTQNELQAEISKHADLSEQNKYQGELDRIIKSNKDNTEFKNEYLNKELTGFIRANLFIGAYRQAASLYNAGNQNDAYETTLAELEKLTKVDFEEERTASFGNFEELIDKASSQKSSAIRTGIDAIDSAMNGGLYPQSWTTFLGGSNAGKSMLMPNLAYFAAMNGKRVFVTVHEDEELPTKLRYLSRFSGVPFTKLLAPVSYLTTDEKQRLELADSVLKEFVKIRFMYTTEATIEAVQHAARALYKEWPFELFLCDYGQCLTTTRFKSLDNTRLLQEFVYSELKQLCLELNVAGAGGAQVNRLGHQTSKKGSDFLRCTDVGESWGIVKKSSNVITMNRSDEAAKNDRIVFLLDKVRNGRCPVAVSCVTDYNRCMTHDGPLANGESQQLELSSMDIGEAQVAIGYNSENDKDNEPASARG